jgi:hypothetical protein
VKLTGEGREEEEEEEAADEELRRDVLASPPIPYSLSTCVKSASRIST